MSAARLLAGTSLDEDVHVDSTLSLPASARRPSTAQRRARPSSRLDPLEEALLAYPALDSREPEPAVYEILNRLVMGDTTGALAAAEPLLVGHRVPALTVSLDVLDEIELDTCAGLLLAHIDGMTELSRVLAQSGLALVDGVRTLCDLIDRRIVVLRSVR
jgi:hypothetical protein